MLDLFLFDRQLGCLNKNDDYASLPGVHHGHICDVWRRAKTKIVYIYIL